MLLSLRSGDVFVPGFRRYADPTLFLLTAEQWAPRRVECCALVDTPCDAATAIAATIDGVVVWVPRRGLARVVSMSTAGTHGVFWMSVDHPVAAVAASEGDGGVDHEEREYKCRDERERGKEPQRDHHTLLPPHNPTSFRVPVGFQVPPLRHHHTYIVSRYRPIGSRCK